MSHPDRIAVPVYTDHGEHIGHRVVVHYGRRQHDRTDGDCRMEGREDGAPLCRPGAGASAEGDSPRQVSEPNCWRVVTTGLIDKRSGRVLELKTVTTAVYVPGLNGRKLTHGETEPA